MATAEAYDGFDDPGLAFTEDQIKEYKPETTSAVRVDWLTSHALLAHRRSQLGEKPKWWGTVAQRMLDLCTWHCIVAELPGIDRDKALDLPQNEKPMRELTIAARKLGEGQDFLDAWRAMVRTEMVQHVTLGRRCVGAKAMSGWGKRERSHSNKIANALVRELNAIEKLEVALRSRVSGSGDEDGAE